MLARVYNKKKKRPLQLTNGSDVNTDPADYHYPHGAGMPSMPMQHADHGGAAPPPPPSVRSRSSRISRAFGGGRHDAEERRGGGGEKGRRKPGAFVKKVFGKKDREGMDKHGDRRRDDGGVMYSEDDEYDDGEDCGEDDYYDEDEEPQALRPRRRFVRSGLTTYEQVISKNSMARRFNRRSYMPSSISVASPSKVDGVNCSGPGGSPVKGMILVDKENSPSNQDPALGGSGGLSSLSSALQEVINSRPTALRSVVDPNAGPARVQRSFVVEQMPDGNLFVASKRVPAGPTRQTMDDSSVHLNRHDQLSSAAAVGMAAGNPYARANGVNAGRGSDMDFVYRQKMGIPDSSSTKSGAASSSAASLLSMSKAGVRRRISGADCTPSSSLGGDNISSVPTALASAAPRLRRSSSSSKIAELAMANQMGMGMLTDNRQRSRSRSFDGLAIVPLRKDSAAMLLQRGSFEDVDALPLTMDDLFERKPSIDKGPMTIDEFMFDAAPAPAPPPPPLRRKGSNGKSDRSKRATREIADDDDDEDSLTRSFLNVKDVDALKRSRSLEEEEKVVTTTEETETEEEYPDFAEERITDDYGSSYEDESAVRTSNITDFLGGFKSRNSMNRNSLAGRNSLGRNSVGKNDFVSRAARSLRNSRKAAQETAMASSELSRKLREARARVPHDLRGDPPTPAKKRSGFRGRDGKRVRFDMTLYCREFEVIEPEESDDEVNQWSQRDSEQDDEDEDDDEEHSTDDDSAEFGVPVPGAVLAAAMTDANAYYSNTPLNYTHPSRFSAAGRASAQENRFSAAGRMSAQDRYSVGRASGQDDKRVSVVSRRSNANNFEVFM